MSPGQGAVVTTPDDSRAVTIFFRKTLADEGWQVSAGRILGNDPVIVFTRDGHRLTMQAEAGGLVHNAFLNTKNGHAAVCNCCSCCCSAIRSIKVPFGIVDRHHRVLWANEALASLHQIAPDALIGNVCHQVCHGREEPCRNCSTRAVLRNGKTQIVEKWYEFPGREKVWGEVHCYPIRGNRGEVAGIAIFAFDVTDRKNKIEVMRNYSRYLSQKLNDQENRNGKDRSGEDKVEIAFHLSDRETEILRFITQGYTNTQIASFLSISANTVKTHVNNIFNKMGVNDRTHAAVIATRRNIV